MTSRSSTPAPMAASIPSYRVTPSVAADGGFDLCAMIAMDATLNWSGIVVIVLSVFNILGSVPLIASILGNRHLWVRSNILLINLCVANILYFLSWSLQYVEFQLHPCWQFGVTICKLSHACKYLSLAAYGIFMMVMSFERYCAITNRFQCPKSPILVSLTWIIAFIFCLPVLILAHMPTDMGCLYVPRREPSGQAYIVAAFIITYAIPSLVSLTLYIIMARVLFSGTPQSTGGQYPGTREFHNRKRMTLTVLSLVSFFIVMLITFHIYELSNHFGTLSYVWHFDFFKQFHHVTAYANFCICPWIVFATSRTHRDAFYMMVMCSNRPHPKLYNAPDNNDNQPADADSPVNSMFTDIASNSEPPAESDIL